GEAQGEAPASQLVVGDRPRYALALLPHGDDAAGVGDVRERVRLEHDEVRALPLPQGPAILQPQQVRAVAGGDGQRLLWTEACALDHQLELAVLSEADDPLGKGP